MIPHDNETEFPHITRAPPFTISKVRSAIPKHLFVSNTAYSLYFFAKDVLAIAFLYWLAIYPASDYMTQWPILYLPWAFITGTYFWALFVVGHDCGHRSFSSSTLVCDIVGHLAHTPLIVPFHSWRLSHKKHHTYHGNAQKDESWVALSEQFYKKIGTIEKFFRFQGFVVFGYTIYLMLGMPIEYYSHFNPYAKTFKKEERAGVALSSALTIGWMIFIAYLAYVFGVLPVAILYGGPILVFNAWISSVTLLHHTHPDVPWYRNEEWNYLRGALSTVDRDYGIENWHHNIGTHVVHHMFTKLPHYNLTKATTHIEPVIREYHRKSSLSPLASLWQTMCGCRFVENTGNVVFFVRDWVAREKSWSNTTSRANAKTD